ncbi:hypothetical protein U1Q18_039973 [Sarracenia purpurea var. burkii]
MDPDGIPLWKTRCGPTSSDFIPSEFSPGCNTSTQQLLNPDTEVHTIAGNLKDIREERDVGVAGDAKGGAGVTREKRSRSSVPKERGGACS